MEDYSDYLKQIDEEFDKVDREPTKEDIFTAWKNGFALGIAYYQNATKGGIETALIENDVRRYDPLFDNFLSSFDIAMSEINRKYCNFSEISFK